MKSVRVTVLVLLSACTLLVVATNADHMVETPSPRKTILNKNSAVSRIALANSTRDENTHEANRNSTTAQALKPKTGNISTPGQATSSSLAATQQRQLQIEKVLNMTDKEVKAKLKELKVQSTLVKEKTDAVTQEQKQVDEMRVQREKLQREAEVAADIAEEKSEAAAKLWKKERAAASQTEDLQAEENETNKFLKQTQKEEASLEHSLAGFHEQLRRVQASLLSMKKTPIPVASHNQQLLANGTYSSTPERNMTGNSTKATPRLRASATGPTAPSQMSPGNSTASTSEGKKETLSKAVKRVQAENERLKHEKDELANKLQLLQEKDELRLNLKQRLLKKEQRSLAVNTLVRKH